MRTTFLLAACGMLGLATLGAAQTPEKKPAKKPPIELLKQSPEEFLKQFDKNSDGFLAKEELPPFLAGEFKKADGNGDGLLNRAEVALLLQSARQMMAKGALPPKGGVDTIVAALLKQYDSNQDGQISKAEAKNRLADGFAKLDQNQDGFLDRTELRVVAQLMQDAKGGPAVANPTDFAAFDANADGRLTRGEVQGTPWAARFADIDTNRDGQLDRFEFEAYLRKNAEAK